MLREKLSIAYVIVIVLTSVISVVLLLSITFQIKFERRNSYQQLHTKLDVYSSQMSHSLALPLWNYDLEQISEIMESQMNDPEVYGISISESSEDIILHSKTRNSNWQITDSKIPSAEDNVLSKSTSIKYSNKNIGIVTVLMSTKFVEAQLKQKLYYFSLLVIFLVLILSFGVFILLWFLVIRPVRSIEKYAVSVSSGNSLFVPEEQAKYAGELFVLNNSINQMVSTLNQRYSALKETEQKFHDLFENTPISIWLEDLTDVFQYFNSLTQNGEKDLEILFQEHPEYITKSFSLIKVIEVNRASCKLFKAKDDKELIENLPKLFTEASIEIFKKALLSIRKEEPELEFETELIKIDGEKCYVIIKWNLVYNYLNKNLLLVSISDITELKKFELILLENEKELKLSNEEYLTLNEELSESNRRILTINEELQLSKEKAEESNQLKTAFLCNMSHEIRTPLNAIVGFSELISEETSISEKTARNINIIQKSSNQLLSIISDILTISRIQTGQEILLEVPLSVNNILDHLKEVFAPRAAEKKLEFLLKKDNPDPLFRIKTDETKFIQILTNLLSNSFKFTKQGSIEFGYNIKENQIAFYVKDTGIGIPYAAQKIIFDRFRQADISISTKYGGTGLGLSISKSFAEMLGGNLFVESEPDKGATFTLTIPYLPVKALQNKEPQKLVTLSKTITILVAEDEDFNFSLIEEIFLSSTYIIKRAKNGREAVEICNSENIDLVLMDIKMPEMDGITAFKIIRQTNKIIPIIAQTAYALEQEKQQLLDMGFTDYISKPIKPRVLLEMVNNLFKTTKD